MTGLPLAPGSRWITPDHIIDSDGTVTRVGESQGAQPGSVLYIDWLNDGRETDCWVVDLRALLRRSGNLPELDELARLRARVGDLRSALADIRDQTVDDYDSYSDMARRALDTDDRALESLLHAEPKEPNNV